jgi:hypothetical protein
MTGLRVRFWWAVYGLTGRLFGLAVSRYQRAIEARVKEIDRRLADAA